MLRAPLPVVLGAFLVPGALVTAASLCGTLLLPEIAAGAPSPFGQEFWKHWGDGRAEIASYDLLYPRYGEPRKGSAITIFVTETFSDEARVKADPGRHAKSDEFPVMKLNLVQDFPTGIYDYNMMTSAFVALEPRGGRPAGSTAKITFSSQEWCGLTYQHLIPRGSRVEHELHSYFDGEADRAESLDYPEDALFEDALYHWARGLAAPSLGPGEARQVRILRSAETARLRHVPVEWRRGKLSRSAGTREITVPAGTFEARTMTAAMDGEPSWTFQVEEAAPHRILRWQRTDGRRADLVASERLPYWQMNANRFEESGLRSLGLQPRPPRTP